MIKFWAGATACLVGLCAGYGLAARNASGTYAKLYSFSSGSVINSSNMNSQFSDMETALTDSLDRNGKGGMLTALRGTDGTVTAPAFAFTSETGTGLYRIGSSDLGVAINQSKKLELTSSLFTVTPNMTASGTLGVTSDFAINTNKFTVTASTGNTLVAGSLGIGGAPTNQFDITIPGSGNTVVGEWLQSSLADGNSVTFRMGKADASGSDAIFRYSKNATALNSTLCMEVFGGSNALCLDGNNKATMGGAATVATTLGVTGATTATGGITVGSGGTATTQVNFGSCTTSGGTPSNCTAAVASGAKCVATQVNTVNDSNMPNVSVSSTTLTITTTNGATKTYNYLCF